MGENDLASRLRPTIRTTNTDSSEDDVTVPPDDGSEDTVTPPDPNGSGTESGPGTDEPLCASPPCAEPPGAAI